MFGEKLCLQWNDFSANITSAFGDLKADKDFTDVTLACDDGQHLEMHKFVLISSSPFFRNLLKNNKHSHPLIYMRSIKFENLTTMVDFLYHGKANVSEENLDSFLAFAGELQLKGLRGDASAEMVEKIQDNIRSSEQERNLLKTDQDLTFANQYFRENSSQNQTNTSIDSETTVALNGCIDPKNLIELDQQIKSMMRFSENYARNKSHGRARICNICGKEDNYTAIMQHIEAKHLNNLKIPCQLCGKVLKTRASLATHRSQSHKQ